MLCLALALGTARAQEPAPVDEAEQEEPADPAPDAPPEVGAAGDSPPSDELTRFRADFDVLADRVIGTASRPVLYNWRRANAQLGGHGSYSAELNHYNTVRGGGLLRLPSGGLLLELGVSYVGVSATPASQLISLTPYRQPGRPSRAEIDFAVVIPLAEGVVTTAPRFIPAAQLVFNAYLDLRYLLYPSGFQSMSVGQVVGAVFSPALTDREVDNLEAIRVPGMHIDRGRYGIMGGFGNDVYFKSGFFISPRYLVAIPLLRPATQTDLPWWWDISLAAGLSF